MLEILRVALIFGILSEAYYTVYSEPQRYIASNIPLNLLYNEDLVFVSLPESLVLCISRHHTKCFQCPFAMDINFVHHIKGFADLHHASLFRHIL